MERLYQQADLLERADRAILEAQRLTAETHDNLQRALLYICKAEFGRLPCQHLDAEVLKAIQSRQAAGAWRPSEAQDKAHYPLA